jgi:hypothetical protein
VNCHNDPDVVATATCAGCAEAFCPNCFVTIAGQAYCAVCKTMAITPEMAPPAETCPEAKEAMKYALVGIFCVGIILEPIAISKALKARAAIDRDPSLGGRGVANAALVVAGCSLLFSVINLLARFKR